MEINLSINFNTTAEMKEFLTQAYPFGAFLNNSQEVIAADTAVEETKKKRTSKKKQSDLAEALAAPVEPVDEPVVPAPTAPVTPAPAAPTPVPVAPTPAPVAPTPVPTVADAPVAPAPVSVASYSVDDLARAAVQLVDAGRQAEIMPLLQKYGVNALPDLAPEQTASFAADLRALGATI